MCVDASLKDAACLQCLLQKLVDCLKGKKSSVGAEEIKFYKVVIIFNVILWCVRTEQKKEHVLLLSLHKFYRLVKK